MGPGSTTFVNPDTGPFKVAAAQPPVESMPAEEPMPAEAEGTGNGPSGGKPALPGDPYHPDSVEGRIQKPPYEVNPQHQKGPSFVPGKSPLPGDAEATYNKSVRADFGRWIGRSSDGHYYQYRSNNAGKAHFAGQIPESSVPKSVIEQLQFQREWNPY